MKYQTVNLVGGFYKDDSLPWSAQDCVNWIPAADDSGQARSEMMLRGAPGLRPVFASVSDLRALGFPQSQNVGLAYSFQFQAAGGMPPYAWSTGGNVPPGLSINSSTGVISGTPTIPGDYVFQVIVTDAAGLTNSQAASISVFDPGSSSGIPIAPQPDPPPTTPSSLVNGTFMPGDGGWTSVGDTVPGNSPGLGFNLTVNGGFSGMSAGRFNVLFPPVRGTYIYRNDSVVNVVAGSTVTASIKFKSDADDYGSGHFFCGILLETFIDAGLTQLARTSVSPLLFIAAPTDWATVTASLICSNYVRMSVLIYGSAVNDVLPSGTQIYFDDATWDAAGIDP